MGSNMLRKMTVPTGILEGEVIPDDPWGRLLLRTGVKAACSVIALRYGAGIFGRAAFAGLCGQAAQFLVPPLVRGQDPDQFQRQAFDQVRRQRLVPQAPQVLEIPVPGQAPRRPRPQDPVGPTIDQPPTPDPTPQDPTPTPQPQPPQIPQPETFGSPFQLGQTFGPGTTFQLAGQTITLHREQQGEFGRLLVFSEFSAKGRDPGWKIATVGLPGGEFIGIPIPFAVPGDSALFGFDLGLGTTKISFQKQALQQFFKPIFKWIDNNLGWGLPGDQAFLRFDPKGVTRELAARPDLKALQVVFTSGAPNITLGAMRMGSGQGLSERTANQFLANAARAGWTAQQTVNAWTAVNHFGGLSAPTLLPGLAPLPPTTLQATTPTGQLVGSRTI